MFDVVMANIGRAAIVEVAPQLVQHVSPGGWLAVSGISPTQCSQVADFLRPLVEVGRHTSGEWSALVLTDVGRDFGTAGSEIEPVERDRVRCEH